MISSSSIFRNFRYLPNVNFACQTIPPSSLPSSLAIQFQQQVRRSFHVIQCLSSSITTYILLSPQKILVQKSLERARNCSALLSGRQCKWIIIIIININYAHHHYRHYHANIPVYSGNENNKGNDFKNIMIMISDNDKFVAPKP